MGRRWPAAGLGALSEAVYAQGLLKEVAIIFINSTVELYTIELTQDWGNRLLEGTNKTFYAPRPRRKEQ